MPSGRRALEQNKMWSRYSLGLGTQPHRWINLRPQTGRIATNEDAIAAAEKAIRVDLAACYRLVALYGWDDPIFPTFPRVFPARPIISWINPYGMMFRGDHRLQPGKIGTGRAARRQEATIPSIPRAYDSLCRARSARGTPAASCICTSPDGTAVSTSKERLLPPEPDGATRPARSRLPRLRRRGARSRRAAAPQKDLGSKT